jgi:3-polyprenyl-4-hydroxybenzoate decarboxylase
MWAVSTRLRADEDVTVLHNLQGNLLDPSQIGHGKTSGLVLDATKPLGEAYPPNARVPEAAVAKYPLSQYQLKKAPC